MLRRSLIAGAALAAASLGAGAAMAQEDYPSRPITMIVPWGAGGGTDAVGRVMASLLQEELGQPVNVVNRTGGSGVVGHSAIANAEADGYTIGIVTIEIDMMHWQGLTDLTYEDFDFLAMVNADPGGVMVSADSEYESLEQLLEAIRTEPKGTFKGSGHRARAASGTSASRGGCLSEDLPPDQVTWVPSEGASPGITDMVAGGVDIVPSSLPEGRAMIEAERVRPLAAMAEERLDLFPDVPTLLEAVGSDWTIAAWRAVAAPSTGCPTTSPQTLEAAIEAAYDSDEYQSFMADRGFGLRWGDAEEATQHDRRGRRGVGRGHASGRPRGRVRRPGVAPWSSAPGTARGRMRRVPLAVR